MKILLIGSVLLGVGLGIKISRIYFSNTGSLKLSEKIQNKYLYIKNNPIKVFSSFYIGTCVGTYIVIISSLYLLERNDVKFPLMTFMEKQKFAFMAGYNLPFMFIFFIYNLPLTLFTTLYTNTEYINKITNYGK